MTKENKTKAELIAEQMFSQKVEKQMKAAAYHYSHMLFLKSRNAYECGFASKHDQEWAERTISMLEELFGKEAFRHLN